MFFHIQIYLSQYRLVLLGSSFPHCGQNVAELFPLSLSTDVSSQLCRQTLMSTSTQVTKTVRLCLFYDATLYATPKIEFDTLSKSTPLLSCQIDTKQTKILYNTNYLEASLTHRFNITAQNNTAWAQCKSFHSYPFLDEFEGTLVPGHFQQLHRTPLIRGETTHLADHVTHKLGVFGQTLEHKREDTLDERYTTK